MGRRGRRRGKSRGNNQRREQRRQKQEQQDFWQGNGQTQGAQSPSGKQSKRQRRKNRQANKKKQRVTMEDHVVALAEEKVQEFKIRKKKKWDKIIRPLVPIELLEDAMAKSVTHKEVVRI